MTAIFNHTGHNVIDLIKANSLAIMAIILISGVILGKAAHKIKLPGIIGHIAAGILIGPYGLGIFTDATLHHFNPITDFALGLITVTVGSHLNYRKLHNAIRRMSTLIFMEFLLVPLLVFLSLYLICKLPLPACLILASIALATAPATVIHTIKENRAKGIFVKTLVSQVALNNVFCVLLFEIMTSVALLLIPGNEGQTISGGQLFFMVLTKLTLSILLGAGVGALLIFITRRLKLRTGFFNFCFIAIMVTEAVEKMFALSPLLSCLILGIVLGNFAPRQLSLQEVFRDLDYTIYASFFTMAGAHLGLAHLSSAGVVAGIYVLARGAGKILAPLGASRITRIPENISRWLGFALMPQAGMAVGLLMVLENNPTFSSCYPSISTIVLTAVVVNEILGPLLVKVSLEKSGETHKDRSRLIEFLQEEYIFIDDGKRTKKEALEKLVDYLIITHHLDKKEKKEILASLKDKEEDLPIEMSRGIAIPHGVIEKNNAIIGVVGVFKQGVDFEQSSPDPVNVAILILVPRKEYKRLLAVTLGINLILGSHQQVMSQIMEAREAAEVYEIITIAENDKFNYFLEDMMEDTAASS